LQVKRIRIVASIFSISYFSMISF